jgi:hypothetical protein
MEYTASLDEFALYSTAGFIILVGALTAAGVLLILLLRKHRNTVLKCVSILPFLWLTILSSWLFAPQSYILNEKELVVVRPVSNKSFLLSEITGASLLNDSADVSRSFGVGGIFGYFGYHDIDSIGAASYYATQLKNNILIVSREDYIVISPDDISLMDKINEKIFER